MPVTINARYVSKLPETLLITIPMQPDELLGEKRAEDYLVADCYRMQRNGADVELLKNGGGRLAIAWKCED